VSDAAPGAARGGETLLDNTALKDLASGNFLKPSVTGHDWRCSGRQWNLLAENETEVLKILRTSLY
jgi:hypothetical protein